MKFKLNIYRPTPNTVESQALPSGVYKCPVCEGKGCDFCDNTGQVTAEKLATYEVSSTDQ